VRKGLTTDDIGDLLGLPLLAVLATHWRDGTTLLSPVWHEWRDNGFNVVTGARDVKAGHLRRDPRASIVVCDDSPPYRGLELRASARLSMLENRSIVRRIATSVTSARKRVSGTPRLQATTCSSAWSRAICAFGISPTTSPEPLAKHRTPPHLSDPPHLRTCQRTESHRPRRPHIHLRRR
jgi:hypothetical protein